MRVTQENCRDFIDAKSIQLGVNVEIGEGTKISAIGGPSDRVEIGDNVMIGKDVLILTPSFVLGDYGTIHKNSRVSGYQPCHIGHNFWMDQNCILNCTDSMTIGNNVGVGAYSQLWTHIKFGDVLEGCRFNSTKAMVVEDDVWFVGHCIVSPIHAHKRSMAMVGSVITKDMAENHIYGGCPAADLSEKIGGQFVPRTIDQKMERMNALLDEFLQTQPLGKGLLRPVAHLEGPLDPAVTYFDLSDRSYTKRRSIVEIEFMKFLLPLAKFIPKPS